MAEVRERLEKLAIVIGGIVLTILAMTADAARPDLDTAWKDYADNRATLSPAYTFPHARCFRAAALQPLGGAAGHAGVEGRVVQGDDGRTVRRLRQPVVEPGQPLRTHFTGHLAGDDGIAADDPHGMVLDDVMQESATDREVRRIPEDGFQRLAVVVIARDQRHRRFELVHDLPERLVAGHAAVGGDIAGVQH